MSDGEAPMQTDVDSTAAEPTAGDVAQTEGSTETAGAVDVGQEAETAAIETVVDQLTEADLPESSEDLVPWIRDLGIPGTDDMSDEDLLAAWEATAAGGGGDVKEPAPDGDEPAPWQPEGFELLTDDGPVELDAETAEFLQGLQINYKALGETHQKSLAEVVRNAQLGHLNQKRYDNLEGEISQLQNQLGSVLDEKETLAGTVDQFESVLQSAAMGNYEPLKAVMQRLAQGDFGGSTDPETQQLRQQVEEYQRQQQGQEFLNNELRPYLQQLAEQKGVTEYVDTLEQEVLNYLSQIPGHLLTQDRVTRFLREQLPLEIDRRLIETGYSNGATPQPETAGGSSGETAELKQEIQQLKAQIKNLTGKKAAEKAKSSPPASGASTGADDSPALEVPEFETAADVFDYLRS